jgi:GTPase SAR1 family protein
MNIIANLNALYTKHLLKTIELIKISEELKNFIIKVPLVGSFSSGKSSLINAFLNENVLAVHIKPETAIPTEIMYSDTDIFLLQKSNGETVKLSKPEVTNNKFNVKHDNILKLFLNNHKLKNINNVCIVDMPGLDSGIEAHSKAIDNYISQSIAYMIIIDSESGGLKDSIINFLKELKLFNFKVYAIIAKMDKKESAIASIKENIIKNIETYIGIQNIKISAVSARKKEINPFVEYLNEINNDSDEIFKNYFKNKLNPLINDLSIYLKMQLTEDNKSIREIEIEEEKYKSKINQLNKSLKNEINKLEVQINGCVIKIKENICHNIKLSAENLADDLLCGHEINTQISQIVRTGIIEGIKNDFEHRLKLCLENIVEKIPLNLNYDANVEIGGVNILFGASIKETVIKAIPIVLRTAGIALTGHLGIILASLLTFFIDSTFTQKIQNEKKRIALEKIYNEIIPIVSSQIHSPLKQFLKSKTEEIEKDFIDEIENKKNIILLALDELKKRKDLNDNETKIKIIEVNNDLKLVGELYEQLK